MPSFSRLLSTLTLVAAATAGAIQVVSPVARAAIVPPGARGVPAVPVNALVVNATAKTDFATIASTAQTIDQKTGASGDPNQAVPGVSVTAVDGVILTSSNLVTPRSLDNVRRDIEQPSRRAISDYTQVFVGNGASLTSPRDASIEGTAYMTYTTVSNATYNVAACLDFCSSFPTCVFANLFYEINNPHLTTSNLKCAIYADTHTAAEKTNSGGQQMLPLPAGKTFILHSGGWSAKSLISPATPSGYEFVFGPTGGANSASGYMGFSLLDRYDVNACAVLCNTHSADSVGGACQYFNIWRAVVNGSPTTYTCAMYFIPTTAATAVYTGQGTLSVTMSRGYKRKNFVIDGGFEGYAPCTTFCFAASYAKWIGVSPVGGTLDASIFFFQPYAHSGNSVGLLGSANNDDTLAGTLSPAAPLLTTAGKKYTIGFFHASSFSGPTLAGPAFVNIKWNGNIVKTINPGYSNYAYYTVTVTATGNDILAFHGGVAPAWSFLDDITVFQI